MHTIKAIGDAEEALASQKALLNDKLKGHQDAWDRQNNRVKETFLEKISKLTQQCENTATVGDNEVAAPAQNVNVGPNVLQLQEALAQAQKLVSEQKELMAAADIRYQVMEAHIASLVALPVDSQPTTSPAASTDAAMTEMSNEQVARNDHATAVVAQSSPESKGKCKGGDHDHY